MLFGLLIGELVLDFFLTYFIVQSSGQLREQ